MTAAKPEKNTGKDRKMETVDRGLESKNTQQELAALKLHVESEQFLKRRRERIASKETFDKIIGKIKEAIAAAKQKIDGLIDTASPDTIAAFTNAWKAWKGGNLESYLGPGGRTARQLWRTEMVAYISEKLVASRRPDKAAVMETLMAAQTVTQFEDDPAEALRTAMYLDAKIKKLAVRKDLAKKMEQSKISGDLADIRSEFPQYTISKINVLVGGNFLAIPPEQAANFKFMRMVFDKKENRIYAQMENGCRGNLVVIELTPPGRVPEGSGKTPVPQKPQVPEGSGRTPVPQKPQVPEGSGRTPVPQKPQVPEGSGKTPVPQKPQVPEGSGKTPVPQKPQVPEGSGRTPVPQKPQVPEGSGKTPVPQKPQVPEGSGRTPVPQKPQVPEGSGRTPVPQKPQVPEGSGRTPVPQKPQVPEGSGRTPVPAPPEGAGKTPVPSKPDIHIPEGTGRTPIAPSEPRIVVPEGSDRTPVPAPPEGAGKTAVPTPPEGTGKTTVPRKAPPPKRGESDDAHPPAEEVSPK